MNSNLVSLQANKKAVMQKCFRPKSKRYTHHHGITAC